MFSIRQPTSQGCRPNKFVACRTLAEIKVLAKKEIAAALARAEAIKNGTAVSKGSKHKNGDATTTPAKKGRKGDTEEIDIESPVKHGGLRLDMIMWGYSQKVQIAGVTGLVIRQFSIALHITNG